MNQIKINYHETILKKYINNPPHSFSVNSIIKTPDGINLHCTEIFNNSKFGIVFVPGITVPRESYYRLLCAFPGFNCVVFDIRGQAYSGGELDFNQCANDINFIGREFKKRLKLTFSACVGHSFGGLALTQSSQKKDHPYDLRISLATPFDMEKTSAKIPKNASLLVMYIHSLYRAMRFPALRDKIVKNHQSFWYPYFRKNPRIVALRVKNPIPFNTVRENSPKLIDLIQKASAPSHFIYAGNDRRLGLRKSLNEDYREFIQVAQKQGFEITMIPGLSHRFNQGKEREFILSYNNDKVIDKISKILKTTSGS